MPLTLMIALVLAFGVRLGGSATPPTADEMRLAWVVALGTGAAVMLLSTLAGQWVRVLAARGRTGSGRVRRRVGYLFRAIDLLALGSYASLLYGVDWPWVVESGLGLRNAVLLDEVVILAPYLILQMLAWLGLYPAERALRGDRPWPGGGQGAFGYLINRARSTFGLVLPGGLIYAVIQDLLARYRPSEALEPWFHGAAMGVTAFLIFGLSPLFVRLAWPTRRLPEGPLRDRLERLARRHRFRCSDILVWDTGGSLVNAGVTGAFPFFRYVLLSDALVDSLEPRRVEAVFGHEIGHIAHRHLGYFAFFLIASLGVMALLGQGVSWLARDAMGGRLGRTLPAPYDVAVQAGLTLAAFGAFFLLVFGWISRRFERQADVFGCRVVSCDREDCPPVHADPNASADAERASRHLCPVGIRIFSDALAEVAALNGMALEGLSWRHGSIARRIAFLEGLEGRPEAERRFQARLGWMRWGLGLVLLAVLLAALKTGALEQL